MKLPERTLEIGEPQLRAVIAKRSYFLWDIRTKRLSVSPALFSQVLPTETNVNDGSTPSLIAGLLVVAKTPFPFARRITSATMAFSMLGWSVWAKLRHIRAHTETRSPVASSPTFWLLEAQIGI